MTEENNNVNPQGLGRDDTKGGQTEQTKWYEKHEGITSNSDVLKYIKDHDFKSESDLARTGYELQKKLGSSYRLPDDLKTLTPEQQADILSRTKTLMDIPDKPEGYDWDNSPVEKAGLPVDANLDTAFRAFCKENGISKATAAKLHDFYNSAMISNHQRNQESDAGEIKAAENELRLSGRYEHIMEGVKRFQLWAAENIKGLVYTDENGEIKNRLTDCLDSTKLGNKIPILQLMSEIYDMFISEGEPIEGDVGTGGVKKSFFDYEKVDR